MNIITIVILSLTISFSMIRGEQIKDFDGNCYNTIQIGNQLWSSSNFKSKHDISGVPIKFESIDGSSKIRIDGYLYNRSTIENNQKLVSNEGWRIPTEDDWNTLINYLGADSAGVKLKNIDQWSNGGDNFNFNAKPTGMYDFTGVFQWVGEGVVYGSKSIDGKGSFYYYLNNDSDKLLKGFFHPKDGVSELFSKVVYLT